MTYLEQEAIELRTDRLILRTIDSTFAARCLDYFVCNKQFFKQWNPQLTLRFIHWRFMKKSSNLSGSCDFRIER